MSRTARTRVRLASVFVLAVATLAACSDSVGSTADTTPTSSPTCRNTGGGSTNPKLKVDPVNGVGARTVGLPGDIAPPFIVHARHPGSDTFVVSGVDASGKATHVFAASPGAYDGVFAVGFVDACSNPTIALQIDAKSAWHLDVADTRAAPRFDPAKGISGQSDAVLSYVGSATKVRVTYSGAAKSNFDITTYAAKGPGALAHATGRFDQTASLPAGPVFLAITARGRWQIGRG